LNSEGPGPGKYEIEKPNKSSLKVYSIPKEHRFVEYKKMERNAKENPGVSKYNINDSM